MAFDERKLLFLLDVKYTVFNNLNHLPLILNIYPSYLILRHHTYAY